MRVVAAPEPSAALTDPRLPSDPREAVTALYQIHGRRLVGLAALLTGDRATGEDVVQEAFLALYRRWPRLRDSEAAPAYLRTAVVNGARTTHRRTGRETLGTPPDSPSGPDPSAAVDRRAVLDALRLLPTRQREVMVLRYYEDLAEGQIAELLGISRGSVKQHASRAAVTLSEILGATS